MPANTLPIALLLAAVLISACRPDGSTPDHSSGPAATATPTTSDNPPPAPPEPAPAPPSTRPPALAGAWYPDDPDTLRRDIRERLDQAPHFPLAHPPRALIVPHAGHRWSGDIAARAYKTVDHSARSTVVILSPNHRRPIYGAALPSVDAFRTPLGDLPINRAFTASLLQAGAAHLDDDVHAEEHAIEIHLPFLQVALAPGFDIVPIIVSDAGNASLQRLARHLNRLMGPDDLLIVSTDFTHYGDQFRYLPFTDDIANNIEALDMGAFRAIATFALPHFQDYRRSTGITVCGAAPILTFMAMAAPKQALHLLGYDTSGAITRDYQNSVSYLAAAYDAPFVTPDGLLPPLISEGGPEILDPIAQATALALARDRIEALLLAQASPTPQELGLNLSPVFAQHLGVFVTLKKGDQLRGCIGTVLPQASLEQGILDRSVDAAINDRRFAPLTAQELPEVQIEISVLTPPQAIERWEDIQIGRHGIILRKGQASALFLPQVALEQGWTLETCLEQLARKAGLPNDAWRTDTRFQVFEAQVFKEAF